MTALHVVLEGDDAWRDIADKPMEYGEWEAIALLPRNEDNPNAVAIRIHLPDGSYVLAQTTAKLFVAAARAIGSRLDRDEPGWLDH